MGHGNGLGASPAPMYMVVIAPENSSPLRVQQNLSVAGREPFFYRDPAVLTPILVDLVDKILQRCGIHRQECLAGFCGGNHGLGPVHLRPAHGAIIRFLPGMQIAL